MTKINAVLSQVTFWVVLWWGIYAFRFGGWAAAWPMFLLALVLLAPVLIFSERFDKLRWDRALGRR